MADVRRFGVVDLLLLVLVLAAAGGARAWYLNACCHNGTDAGPYQVEDDRAGERDALVRSLADGRGFAGPAPFHPGEERTAHVAPLYPWLLSLLHRSLGDADKAAQAARWAQAGLGALAAGFCFLFARRAFHSLLAGTLAGLLAAVHPFWVIDTAALADGTLATFLMAFALFLGARGSQAGGPMTSLLYGVALAGLALTRAALLPFAFAAELFYLWRCRWLPRGWLAALLAFLGFVNALLPWGYRNVQAFHEVLPIADSTHLHLWMGNNPLATGGPQSEADMLQALARARGTDPAVLAAQLERLDQPARYQMLARDVWDDVRFEPDQTLRRRLHAGLAFFVGENGLRGERLWREEGPAADVPDWLPRALPALLAGSLLGMLALGALGWRWSYGWRHQSLPAALAMVWVPLPYVLSHADLWHGPRLPLDAVLLSYAAFALACAVPAVGGFLFQGARGDAGG